MEGNLGGVRISTSTSMSACVGARAKHARWGRVRSTGWLARAKRVRCWREAYALVAREKHARWLALAKRVR